MRALLATILTTSLMRQMAGSAVMRRVRTLMFAVAGASIWVAIVCPHANAQAKLDPRCVQYASLVQQLVTKTFGPGSPESEATAGMLVAVLSAFGRSKIGTFSAEEQAAVNRFLTVSSAAMGEVVKGLQSVQEKLRGKNERERKRLMEAGLAADLRLYVEREETLKYALNAVVACRPG